MEINILSPINQLGYGVAGLNIVKSLSLTSKVALWPIGPIEICTQQDADIIKSVIQNAYKPNFNCSCIRIWHQHDMSQFVGKGNHIGFPFFELDTFSEQEKHHLNSLDYIFVSSQWAKDICLKQLLVNEDKVKVVPLGVDRQIFKVSPKHNGKTIFLNCGKWEVRKGHDILIDIFCDTFNQDDDVELWMMSTNPFLKKEEAEEWENMYLKSKLGDKVKIIPRQNTQYEVYNIMSEVDCGVFPSRAEGWNLELLELMSCGKHVIATNYSAHTEFCNNSNCHLVSINDLETAYDGKWFHGNGMWAKIDVSAKQQISNFMQQIHQQKKSGTLPINQAGILTAEQFSWSNTARKIMQYV